jgi:hypothetical protein
VAVDVHLTANMANSRTETMVVADYSLGEGVKKHATLTVRNVRALAGPLEEVDCSNAENEMS